MRIYSFNAKDIIDKPKYARHIEHCPDRNQLDRVLSAKTEELREATKEGRPEPVDSAPGFQFSAGDDCWDDEVSAVPRYRRLGSYDPQKAIANRAVFRWDRSGRSVCGCDVETG